MFGAAIDDWREHVRTLHALVFSEPRGPELAAKLKTLMDAWPHPHNRANYELASERACSVGIVDPPHYFKWLRWFVNENAAVKGRPQHLPAGGLGGPARGAPAEHSHALRRR